MKKHIFLIGLFIIGLIIVSYYWFNQPFNLPQKKELDPKLFDTPKQQLFTPVLRNILISNHSYIFRVVGEISLYGLVVVKNSNWTFYNSSPFVDFCIIWGKNLAQNNYKKYLFQHKQGLCIAEISKKQFKFFDKTSFSNNHLIGVDQNVRMVLKNIAYGDQVYIKGQLVDYQKNKGQWIYTSVVRTDEGNGACEIILVKEAKIIKKAIS